MTYDQTIKLSNGVNIPILGLGTFKMTVENEAYEATLSALRAGYRHIDTASVYNNEEEVGRGIFDSKIKREQLFITTKLPSGVRTYEETKKHFQQSLKKLKLDYIDLYLIHWPNYYENNYEVYRAFEDLYKEGKIKALGVSNFQIHHLTDLLNRCTIKPTINQVECHIGLQQRLLQKFCQAHDIVIEAHTPLMRGEVFQFPELEKIAKKYNKSIANIACRYLVEQGIVVIPKSSKENRIIENANIFDFKLTDEEMNLIGNIDFYKRYTTDPDNNVNYKV